MLTGALLGLMEQLALDIVTLTEEIDESEFFASRLTRVQTLKLLGSLVQTAANLPAEARERMPQVDWAAWAALAKILPNPKQHPLQIWVAIREITPMTVQHLHDYRRVQPQLFSIAP